MEALKVPLNVADALTNTPPKALSANKSFKIAFLSPPGRRPAQPRPAAGPARCIVGAVVSAAAMVASVPRACSGEWWNEVNLFVTDLCAVGRALCGPSSLPSLSVGPASPLFPQPIPWPVESGGLGTGVLRAGPLAWLSPLPSQVGLGLRVTIFDLTPRLQQGTQGILSLLRDSCDSRESNWSFLLVLFPQVRGLDCNGHQRFLLRLCDCGRHRMSPDQHCLTEKTHETSLPLSNRKSRALVFL